MPSVSRSAKIADLQAKTHECLKPYISPDEPLAILDFPDIKNPGDSAIWLGEMAYLKKYHGKRPSYVSTSRKFSVEGLKRAVPTGTIFIQGGGTFGDIWVSHQDYREKVLELFPDRRIVHFPQSIHYNSEQRVEQSARAIGRHKNFVLLVRDEESLAFAQKRFDCEVKLCPDMAFCIGEVTADAPQIPVLAMLRDDKERIASIDRSAHPDVPTEDWIAESTKEVRIAKAKGMASALLSPSEMVLRKLDAAAHYRFWKGIRQIARGRAIVTDRLHIHICSLLIGRPHAVLDNNYGKVRNFMRAFSGGTDLAYLATSLDDGIAWAREQATTGART